MKNQKGITLVALVVTIVVLLILAGVSIAMLDGDNGIITNAQTAKYANTEAQVIEEMGLAYNTAKTHVMVQSALTDGYNPTSTTNAEKIKDVIEDELDGTGYTVELSGSTITMTYSDSTFVSGGKYNPIVGTLTLTTNDIEYTTQPTRQAQ